MNDPRRRVLVIRQGVTTRRSFRLVNKRTGETLDPIDEGYTEARLQVRTAHLSEGGELLLDLSTDNGGITLGLHTDDNGVVSSGRLYISAAAASNLDPWGEGVFDLLMRHGTEQIDPVASGVAVLWPVVTSMEA